MPTPIEIGGAGVNSVVAELSRLDRWVCWRSEDRGGPKPTTVPYTPAGNKAKSTDPRTWSTFHECWQAAFVGGRFDGVGIVFDGSDELLGIDLDDCVEDGRASDWAFEIIRGCNSYAEISPSGTGIKIFALGELPEPGRRNGKLEIYAKARFFTVTGEHFDGSPETLANAQPEIDRLWAQHFKQRKKSNGAAHGDLPSYPGRKAIDALLQDRMAADLWHQRFNVTPSNDRSQSGWDLAFASYLMRKGLGREQAASFLRAYRYHHEPTKGKQDRDAYIWSSIDQASVDSEDETFNSVDGESQPKPKARRQYNLAETHAVFRRWLGSEYDTATLNAVLAAAAAERLPGDPLWLLVISGPGNAKTETVQSLRGAGGYITSTITSEGALLSATAKRDRSKNSTGGLLRKIGERGLLVIKDVTSILSADRHARGPVLAALREIYDGLWERNVGSDGGQTLTWQGRIVVVGAVTTAWDTAHSVVSAMGDRFVLIRADSNTGRLQAGKRAMRNVGREEVMRTEMAEAVGGLIEAVDPAQAIDLTDDETNRILRAANTVTRARTGVEFDYRGEVIDAHAPEMPTRFAKQLSQILRGGVAIGVDRQDALDLAIRCARDSMPPLRLELLHDVANHFGARVIDIRRRVNKPRMTVDRQLQALHILGLLTCQETEEIRYGREVQVRHYSVSADLDLAALSCAQKCE
jgi:hypothetical protein